MRRMIVIIIVLCFSIVSESSGQDVKIKFRAPSDYRIGAAYYTATDNYNKYDFENDGISEIIMSPINSPLDSTMILIYDGASYNPKGKIKSYYKYGSANWGATGFLGFCDIDGDNIREAVVSVVYLDTAGFMFVNLSNDQVKYLIVVDNNSMFSSLCDIDKDGYVEVITDYLIIGHSATPVVNPVTNLGKRTAASTSLFPNPFTGNARIEYYVPTNSSVKLKIFDTSGKLVRTLIDGTKTPGDFSEIWNGKGDRGENLSSGQYYYTIQIGDFVTNKKMIMLK